MGKKDKVHSAVHNRTDVPEKKKAKNKKKKLWRKVRKRIRKTIKKNGAGWIKYFLCVFIVTVIFMIIFEKIRFVQSVGAALSTLITIKLSIKGVIRGAIYGMSHCQYMNCIGEKLLDLLIKNEQNIIVVILRILWHIFELVFQHMHKFMNKIRSHKLRLKYSITILIILTAAVAGSKNNVCAKTVYAFEEGIAAFDSYGKSFSPGTVNRHGTLGISAITSKTESEEKINNLVESIENGDSLYIYSEEEMIAQFGQESYLEAKSIVMTEDDRTRELNLSSEDYSDIFHLSGEYQIENWDNQEEVNAAVLRKIQDGTGLKKNNEFDENAPEWLQHDVDEASRKEAERHTFSERVEILGTRTGAYGVYPKSSLAKLASNDNQALALALVLIGGKKQTEMYYYGEAIIWGLEYLKFMDVSTSSVKEKVNWIAKRYKDIQFIYSETDQEYRYSEKLAIAYENAANAF